MQLGRAPTPPASARVDSDLLCHCGYNLRGLLSDANCPECNEPVERALRLGLALTPDRRWMARCLRACGMLIAAGIISLAGGALVPWASHLWMVVLGIAPLLGVAWLMTWFAMWEVGAPGIGRRDSAFRRRALRFFASICATAPLLLTVQEYWPAPGGNLAPGFLRLWLLCAVPATLLFYDRLRIVSQRLHEPALATSAALAGIVVAFSISLIARGLLWDRLLVNDIAFAHLLYSPLPGMGFISMIGPVITRATGKFARSLQFHAWMTAPIAGIWAAIVLQWLRGVISRSLHGEAQSAQETRSS